MIEKKNITALSLFQSMDGSVSQTEEEEKQIVIPDSSDHFDSLSKSPDSTKKDSQFELDECSTLTYDLINLNPELKQQIEEDDDDDSISLDETDLDDEEFCFPESEEDDEEESESDEDEQVPREPQNNPKQRRKRTCPYPDCTETFTRPDRLRIHISSNHTHFYRFKCTFENCQESFASNQYLRRHLARHDRASSRPSSTASFVKLPRYKQCPSCPKSFHRKIQLRIHRFVAHGEPMPFQCSDCDKNYPVKYMLDKHKKFAHKSQRYKCDYPDCMFISLKWTELRKHMANDHKTSLSCDLCGKQYKRASSLQVHIEVKHSNGGSVVKFVCDRAGCKKSYSRESTLKNHQRAAHDEPRFSCGKCGRKFRYKQKATEHEEKCCGSITITKKQTQKKVSKPKRKPKPIINEDQFDENDLLALERADQIAKKRITGLEDYASVNVNDNVAEPQIH